MDTWTRVGGLTWEEARAEPEPLKRAIRAIDDLEETFKKFVSSGQTVPADPLVTKLFMDAAAVVNWWRATEDAARREVQRERAKGGKPK